MSIKKKNLSQTALNLSVVFEISSLVRTSFFFFLHIFIFSMEGSQFYHRDELQE